MSTTALVTMAWGLWCAAAALAVPGRTLPLGGTGPARRRGPLARVGAAVRRRLPGAVPGADHPVEETIDRIVGGAVLLTAALLAVRPTWALVSLALAAAAPRWARRDDRRRRDEEWAAALPDAVDLLALGLASGVTVADGLALVAPHVPPPVGTALARAEARFRHGAPLADALAPVADATVGARSLVGLLVAAHCDGAPVVDALSRLAAELRAEQRRAVEARSRQVPVRMLFPLVGCTLPAFVLLTVVPPVVAALSDLGR